MKTLLCLGLTVCLTLSAPASQGEEGGLRELLAEAHAAILGAQTARNETAAALSAALEAKAAAQVRADVLADQARANAESATKSLEAYRHAVAEFNGMRASRNRWRLWCVGLGLSIGVYLGLRLHPATRLLIP